MRGKTCSFLVAGVLLGLGCSTEPTSSVTATPAIERPVESARFGRTPLAVGETVAHVIAPSYSLSGARRGADGVETEGTFQVATEGTTTTEILAVDAAGAVSSIRVTIDANHTRLEDFGTVREGDDPLVGMTFIATRTEDGLAVTRADGTEITDFPVERLAARLEKRFRPSVFDYVLPASVNLGEVVEYAGEAFDAVSSDIPGVHPGGVLTLTLREVDGDRATFAARVRATFEPGGMPMAIDWSGELVFSQATGRCLEIDLRGQSTVDADQETPAGRARLVATGLGIRRESYHYR